MRISIYTDTRLFPSDERFGLTNQMRTGGGFDLVQSRPKARRVTPKRISRALSKSQPARLFEVVSQAFIAKRQGFLRDDRFQILYQAAEEQSRMQSGLRKDLLQ